jgi:hypothetical protein
MDQNSFLIENSSGLSLQVTQPASITTFSVTNSQGSINQMDSLNFIFQASNFLPVGAILELVFPSDLPISQLTLSSVAGISKIEPVVNYTINGQTVRMTNAISVYYTALDVHYFRVSSIQNPPSTKPTGSFQFNIYTKDNFIMYSLKTTINYTAAPGSFNNVSVQQLNPEINKLTRYTFSLTPANSILAGGYIKVTFPAEFVISDRPQVTCSGVFTGVSPSAQCSIANKILSITNGFPSNFQPSVISFYIDDVRNYFCVKETSSFTIATYTSDNYAIDMIDTGISVNFKEGSLINPQITPASLVNYEITNYVISFETDNSLPSDSRVNISFPSGFLDNVESQNCSIMINTTNSKTTCTINESSVTINLANTTQLTRGTMISIDIPHIRNNRSLKPSDPVGVLTLTSDGYNIDKTKEGLVVTNTAIANISKVTISPNSLMTGDITTYIFSIQLATVLYNNDTIKLTIPSQIGISVSNNVSVIGRQGLIDTLLPNTISNSQGVSTISITATLATSITSTSNFEFEIQNLKNPISLKPTDSFTLGVLTSDLYDIEKYVQPLVITMTTPNTLKETFVKATVTQINSVSDYIVQLMPYNIIPKGGFIIVEYPVEYSVIDGSCLASIGFPGTITCSHNASLKEIKVEGAFEGGDYSPSLLQFTIKGLKNTMPEGLTTTSTFKIYTKTTENYSIDNKLDGLNIIFTCQFPCATCQADQTTCLSCIKNGSYQFLRNGTCLARCPDGFTNLQGSFDCNPCNTSCTTCAQGNPNHCLTCNALYQYYITETSECVSQCPDGYYPNGKVCVKCQSPCNTCLSNTQCTSCLDSYLYHSSKNKCLSTCPSDFTIQQENKCIDCSTNCNTCKTTISQCTSCANSLALMNNQCIPNCPTGFANANGICTQCDTNCLVCEGALKTCLKCIDGLIIDNGVCVSPSTSCQSGQYLINGLCRSCSTLLPNCTDCLDQYTCVNCSTNYLLQLNKCVDRCDMGYYNVEKSCERCMAPCKACNINASSCTSCFDNYFLYNGKCINVCPVGMYFNKVTCIPCNTNCDVCNSNEVCLQCRDSFYNYQGICYSTCPYGFTPDNLTKTCKTASQSIPLRYADIFKLPVTNFIFLIGFVFISIIIYCIKVHEPQTFYYGSAIPFLALLTFIHNLVYIYFVFNYGVPVYFSLLMITFIMSAVLNNAFIIVYDYYTSQDSEFTYWKGSRGCISVVFFLLAYVIDYKIIRLFYSRLNKIDFLSAKFKNYRRIHYPYRTLVIVEFIFVIFPMVGLNIYTIITTQAFINVWWLALESLIMIFIFSIYKIADLIVNKNLNEDFYNQQKDHPDILPYSFMYGSNGKLRIKKKFDFNSRSRDDYSFCSRTCLKKNSINNVEDNVTNNEIIEISFCGKGDDQVAEKMNYKLDHVMVKKYTDDTNLGNIVGNGSKLSNIRNSLIKTKKAYLRGDLDGEIENFERKRAEKPLGVIEKLSSGIKNMIKLISPNKKEVSRFNDKEYTKLNKN